MGVADRRSGRRAMSDWLDRARPVHEKLRDPEYLAPLSREFKDDHRFLLTLGIEAGERLIKEVDEAAERAEAAEAELAALRAWLNARPAAPTQREPSSEDDPAEEGR
jgi:hypothetical protein